jgi:hypothetical protein
MKKQKVTAWRLVCKALGEKASKCDKEADKIALIRLLITAQILITNFFIIYGVIRVNHFPIDKQQKIEVVFDGYVLPEYQTPPRRELNKPFEFE